eukprot:2275689-Rhodomonas_salina.2
MGHNTRGQYKTWAGTAKSKAFLGAWLYRIDFAARTWKAAMAAHAEGSPARYPRTLSQCTLLYCTLSSVHTITSTRGHSARDQRAVPRERG